MLKVLNPDDSVIYAGEIVHGGIAAEQYAVLKQADVIGRMARSFNYLEWKIKFLEVRRINGYEPVLILLLERWIFVLSFAC